MNKKKTNYLTAILLALILAFSLAGISNYFPTNQEIPFFSQLIEQGGQPSEISGVVGFIINLPNITLRDNGTIEPKDAPIKNAGETYILTGDVINQTIVIQRNNVVIDGAGYKIQGAINAATGINLHNVNNVTLRNIEVDQFWRGIVVTDCSNLTINGNKITTIRSKAILIDSSSNTIISNNNIDFVGTAIEVTGTNGYSRDITVVGNTITNAVYGTTINASFSTINENNLGNIKLAIGTIGDYTTVSKNNVINGISAIMIIGSHCMIFGNSVSNFSEASIIINKGTNCSVYENMVSDSECAIILRNSGDEWVIENNVFYHNNFVNNTQSVNVELPSHPNVWDNGFEGNYWSNYSGVDDDGDGIGDTFYIIDEYNIDRYPLIRPYETEQTNMLFVYLGIVGLVVFAVLVVVLMFVNNRKQLKK